MSESGFGEGGFGEGPFGDPPTIAVTAAPATASMVIAVEGGTPGGVLYVFRRDSDGVGVVRDTSAATVVWPASGPLVIVDHEARQGEQTDYILATVEGVMLASERVIIPKWGTWLKSPARPHLNVRCYLEGEGAIARPARRQVMHIEGGQAVVLHEPRATPVADEVRLITLDGPVSDALVRLLQAGDTLMLDADPVWRLSFRYISVGDYTVSRPYYAEGLGLDGPARMHTLSEVYAVEPPIGVTVTDPTLTYDALPTLFVSYAAMATVVPTYEALATGEL